MLQILALILLLQGMFIVILSSHFGPAIGVLSMILGIVILTILPPKLTTRKAGTTRKALDVQDVTFGIRFVDFIYKKTGGYRTTTVVGIAIIVCVLFYNTYMSSQPNIGDLDLLSITMGGLLVAYPFVSRRFKVETTFSLLFITFVVVILVIPQAVSSMVGNSPVGNWYVHYMLAAPFASALNMLGIEASAYAEVVSITLKDGSTHLLGISTACAGLYSFSIFVSAFFSFVLVFERLPLKVMAIVLSLGLLIAYFGNLFRMVIIGVIGYYKGMDALLWAHDNIGWIVFLAWSSIFWYVVIRYADSRTHESGTPDNRGIRPPEYEGVS